MKILNGLDKMAKRELCKTEKKMNEISKHFPTESLNWQLWDQREGFHVK